MALSQGLTRYEGNHHIFCYTCDGEAGKLLPCTFCPNVQHRECGVLLSSDDSNLSGWVCDGCLNDVEDMEDEEDREIMPEEDEDFSMLVTELDL